MKALTQELALGVFAFCLSFNLLLLRIENPPQAYFDETRYLPAGRALLAHSTNENWSHPLLAKFFIGTGLKCFGDRPTGARIFGAFFGALGLVAMGAWALILFQSALAAFAVVVLCAVNQLHFVLSRVATLEVYLFACIALAMSSFSFYWLDRAHLKARGNFLLICLTAVFFGLAMSCKWFGVVPYLLCVSLLIGKQIWNRKYSLSEVSAFILVPLVVYLVTFGFLLGMEHPKYAPALSQSSTYSLKEILPLQIKMLEAQTQFTNEHQPYASRWYTWPLLVRPMWLEKSEPPVEKAHFARGILLTGNPLICWAGLLAVIACLWWGVRSRAKEPLLIGLSFLSLWLSWAIIPRRVEYFYYYYPAVMVLSLALVFAARKMRAPRWFCATFLIAGVAIFLFFYPVMTDQLLPLETLQRRLLFSTWR